MAASFPMISIVVAGPQSCREFINHLSFIINQKDGFLQIVSELATFW